MLMRGKIKCILSDKDYGYIAVDGQEKDAKLKTLCVSGVTLQVGMMLEFKQKKTTTGNFIAYDVRLVTSGSPVSAAGSNNSPHSGTRTGDVRTRYKDAYYLPIDTAKILSSTREPIDNLALKVQKYIRVGYNRDNERIIPKINKTVQINETVKRKYDKLLARIHTSQRNMLDAEDALTIEGMLGGRMVIGLGSASVFNTGMILCKPYGFPYIPGSSVKGAFRAFLHREAHGVYDLDALFGTEAQRGKLTFFDAYPDKIERLETDIMNIHFNKWYSGDSSGTPTDDDKLSLVTFYGVPAGTTFTFRIGGTTDETLSDQFIKMLAYAGLGAKTAVGYGWFHMQPSEE